MTSPNSQRPNFITINKKSDSKLGQISVLIIVVLLALFGAGAFLKRPATPENTATATQNQFDLSKNNIELFDTFATDATNNDLVLFGRFGEYHFHDNNSRDINNGDLIKMFALVSSNRNFSAVLEFSSFNDPYYRADLSFYIHKSDLTEDEVKFIEELYKKYQMGVLNWYNPTSNFNVIVFDNLVVERRPWQQQNYKDVSKIAMVNQLTNVTSQKFIENNSPLNRALRLLNSLF